MIGKNLLILPHELAASLFVCSSTPQNLDFVLSTDARQTTGLGQGMEDVIFEGIQADNSSLGRLISGDYTSTSPINLLQKGIVGSHFVSCRMTTTLI